MTFDGTPAPLLWVQDSQINVVVPWSLTPGQNTEICVSMSGAAAGATGNCLTWPVVQTAPGVFMASDSRYAAVVNQDGTINSAANPAAPGSIVSVFATGLGPINPAPADGTLSELPLSANVLSVSVEATYPVPPFNSLISSPLPVSYVGPAPTLVSGVTQINFQIPPANSAVPDSTALYLSLPATASQEFYVYVSGQ